MSTEQSPPRSPAGAVAGAGKLRPYRKIGAVLALAGAAATGVACRQDMHDQPRLEPYEASTFFADGMASRHLPAGTVARGQLNDDTVMVTGKQGEAFVAELPMPTDRALLERGRERYGIYCSACHGALGDGQGMVVRRGFKQPPSFHDERLRTQPVGYYFDVMTRGFGVMPSYSHVIPPADRWAIAAYLRVLQQSQRVPLAELSEEDRQALANLPVQGAAVPPTGAPHGGGHGSAATGDHTLPNEAPQPGHASPDAPMGQQPGVPPGTNPAHGPSSNQP